MDNIPQDAPGKTKKPKVDRITPILKIVRIFLICVILAVLGFFGANYYFNNLSTAQSRTYSFSKANLSFKNLNLFKRAKQKTSQGTQKDLSLPFSFGKALSANRGEKSAKPVNGLVLKGILYSPEKSFVLINNSVLKEGDKIGDAIILQITSDYVELENKTSRFKLTPLKSSR